MDFAEIKNKSTAELKELVLEWRAKIRNLRFKASSGGLKQVHQISILRHDIAKALTILKDRK